MPSLRCSFRVALTTAAVLVCWPISLDVRAQVATTAPVVRELSGPKPQRSWEFVLSYYLGAAHTQGSQLVISQPSLGTRLNFDRVSYRGRSFNGPLYYGIRGGFFSRAIPALGFETELVHLKVFTRPEERVSVGGTHLGQPVSGEIALGDIVQRYSISHGVNLLLLNVVGRYSTRPGSAGARSRLILSARFGAGPTLPHTESTIDGQRQEQFELGRLALQAGGGAELRLARGLYLLSEFKFTRTRQKGKIFSGEAESLLRSEHATLGLSYHF